MSRPKPLDPRSSLAAALGSEVRKLREQQRWSQRDLANRVYVTPTRIAQIELATDPPSEDLAADLDRVLKADDELNVAWWHMNRARHPEWVRKYIDLEERAHRMRYYAAQLVPGLLQTTDYARALFKISQPFASDSELEQHVKARMSRRGRLEGPDPLHLWVVLDESILLRPISDDPAIMHGQLGHLLAMAEARRIELQVLPLEAGGHGALGSSLILLDIRDGSNAAYLEGAGSNGEVVESAQAVNKYAMVYDHLMLKSLSPADSRALDLGHDRGALPMSPVFGSDLSNATWRKSSYSNGQGGECVEVAQDFPGAATWRKSSYSDSQGGACLEVADTHTGIVPVRDSKDPERAALVFGAAAWAAFVDSVRRETG